MPVTAYSNCPPNDPQVTTTLPADADKARPAADASTRRRLLFRWVLIAAQAATIWVTWPLWQVRVDPPNLPAIQGLQIDFGWWALATLALAGTGSWVGILAHCLVLAAAMAADQMRMQPQLVSLAILLWGTLPSQQAQAIARAHMIALWFFSGFHKLLSPGFFETTAPWLWTGTFPNAAPEHALPFGYFLAIAELAVAPLILWPRTRLPAALLALCLHAGILFSLSPWAISWNRAVWPWNLALMFSGLALFAFWKDGPRLAWRQLTIATKSLCLLLLLSPLLYYSNHLDASLAHCLYSGNKPKAWVVDRSNAGIELDAKLQTWEKLGSYIPPTARLFERCFLETAGPFDRLLLRDPRRIAKRRGYGETMRTYKEVERENRVAKHTAVQGRKPQKGKAKRKRP